MLHIWQPWWKNMVIFGSISRQYFQKCKLAWVLNNIFGPILDDRLKEKSWNPERVPTVVTLSVCPSVCPSVCARATGHSFWPRNLIFGLSDPWNMRKKLIFFVFRNFYFYAFYRSGHTFDLGTLFFGLSDPWNMRKKTFFCFSKVSFLRFL